MKSQNDEAAFTSILEKEQARLEEVKTFEGWVTEPPREISSKMTSAEVADGYIILDPKGEGWGVQLFSLVLGLLALGGGLRGLLSSRRK